MKKGANIKLINMEPPAKEATRKPIYTPLQQHLMEEAKETAMKYLVEARKLEGIVGRFIEFPLIIDDVLDSLVYDKQADKFVALKYAYATHGAVSIDELHPMACMCDDFEVITLRLPEDWLP